LLSNYEKNQPSVTFVRAGQNAFLMGISLSNNPYTDPAAKELWDKGFRSARRKFDANKRPAVRR
jgi:ribosome modulation factor